MVGPKEALSTRIVPVREINWLGDAPLNSRPEWPLSVKIRIGYSRGQINVAETAARVASAGADLME